MFEEFVSKIPPSEIEYGFFFLLLSLWAGGWLGRIGAASVIRCRCCARTSDSRRRGWALSVLLLPRCRLQIFIFWFIELTDTRSGMLDAMPCHLQYLCRCIAGSLVRLASRYLHQVVYLLRQFCLDVVQRFQKLLCVVFGCLLTGFLFAELMQCLTCESKFDESIRNRKRQ